MKYFIDTEFIEGTQKNTFPISLFNKESKPTIDLISIGIVAEDGREYYAISKDFNLKEAWNRYQIKKNFGKPQGHGDKKEYWLRENVLKPIWEELKVKEYGGSITRNFTYDNFKWLIKNYGKTNKQIAKEIQIFVSELCLKGGYDGVYYENEPGKVATSVTLRNTHDPPTFYGYYADYDWVAVSWLFGKMIDLPNGFPKYCIDLKQELERLNETLGYNCDAKGKSYRLQEKPNYPKQINEHNALSDAKWNFELYKFLKQL